MTGATSLTALAGNQTSFVAPGTGGDVVVRLTVTDDLGRTDSIDAAVRINGMAPPPPPPPSRDPGGSSGGGGAADPLTLLLVPFIAGLAARRRKRSGQ